MKEKLPEGAFIISTLEALRILSDPLRNQILEHLALGPATVRQVAESLGLSPNKLYYHINLLESAGLVVVSETRMVGNMVEKEYKTTASSFYVDPALLDFSTQTGKENLNHVLASTIDLTRDDMLRSLEARTFELSQGSQDRPRELVINRLVARLDEAQTLSFHTRLVELLKEYDAISRQESSATPTHAYALTIAFYPRFTYPDREENKDIQP